MRPACSTPFLKVCGVSTIGRQYEGRISTLNSVIAEIREVHELDVKKVADLQQSLDEAEQAGEEKAQVILRLHSDLGAAQSSAREWAHLLQVGICVCLPEMGKIWCAVHGHLSVVSNTALLPHTTRLRAARIAKTNAFEM